MCQLGRELLLVKIFNFSYLFCQTVSYPKCCQSSVMSLVGDYHLLFYRVYLLRNRRFMIALH